jgi:hypothetical protein
VLSIATDDTGCGRQCGDVSEENPSHGYLTATRRVITAFACVIAIASASVASAVGSARMPSIAHTIRAS